MRSDASKGVLLVLCAVAALLLANSGARGVYSDALTLPVPVPGKPLTLQLFINDFLMAGFFLLVGMELKRELVTGQLRSRDRVMVPALAALGGMAVPAGIYCACNRHNPDALSGWAIPCATDIAFALGVLALLGSRVPVGLKVFLTALAVLGAMWWMNVRRVARLAVYLLLGALLWWLTLKSGVHATLAGVATAMMIPMTASDGRALLEEFEHALAPWINFAVLPVFALANAGVSFSELGMDGLTSAISVGTAGGLVVGKMVGVFGAAWLAVRMRLGALPERTTWSGLLGVSILCGIGFTMSIFIAELAFVAPADDPFGRVLSMQMLNQAKAGILLGSALAAVLGLSALAAALRAR
jgi:NhaA family Na+:H+ antiporter